MTSTTTNPLSLSTNLDIVRKHKFFLIIATVLILTPFLTKPVHMDDPVFIWVAQYISTNPWDFFGFDVNWYGHVVSVAEINKNPPLTSYFMALFATLLGWSELALHIAFIIPAIALILGTYRLAQLFGANPLGAALSMLCCPVVLISTTTLMVDIFMLSLWIWAVVYWVDGINKQHIYSLLYSACLITLAALTKYIAISLLPLLFVYSLIAEKKLTKNTAALLIPVFLLSLFFWYMQAKYGQNFLSNIFGFSVDAKTDVSKSITDSLIVGMIFIGGCLLFPLFYIQHLFNKTELLWLFGLFCILLLTFFVAGEAGYTSLRNPEGIRYGLLIQWPVFFALGVCILYLLYREMRKNNQPLSWLLFFWIAGILFFALFLNWSTNGRSILTITPVVTILMWRQLSMNESFKLNNKITMFLPLIPAFLVAITVTWADYRLARSAQEAAIYSVNNHANVENTLWFQGSWGFQYYMQQYGAKRIAVNKDTLVPGDILVMPNNNSNTFPVPRDRFELVEIKKFAMPSFVSVMSPKSGAGFYTSIFGSSPYVLGKGYPEVYYILKVVESWKVVAPAN